MKKTPAIFQKDPPEKIEPIRYVGPDPGEFVGSVTFDEHGMTQVTRLDMLPRQIAKPRRNGAAGS